MRAKTGMKRKKKWRQAGAGDAACCRWALDSSTGRRKGRSEIIARRALRTNRLPYCYPL
uniref:Uncharacterized protein n=1 Tax=Oryza sativa subsp. japonica TaxID=39947 RepID=Q6ZF28_ORYSJ|nr:hypothetical protein [Oryza sativa Japonica Group]